MRNGVLVPLVFALQPESTTPIDAPQQGPALTFSNSSTFTLRDGINRSPGGGYLADIFKEAV